MSPLNGVYVPFSKALTFSYNLQATTICSITYIYSICKISKSSTSHSQQYIAYLDNLSSNLTQSDKGYSCEQCFMQNKTCIWPTACSFTDSGMHPAPKLSHIRQHSFVPLRRLKMDGGNGKRFFIFFLKL